jgi:hypothetical protein
MPRGTKPE